MKCGDHVGHLSSPLEIGRGPWRPGRDPEGGQRGPDNVGSERIIHARDRTPPRRDFAGSQRRKAEIRGDCGAWPGACRNWRAHSHALGFARGQDSGGRSFSLSDKLRSGLRRGRECRLRNWPLPVTSHGAGGVHEDEIRLVDLDGIPRSTPTGRTPRGTTTHRRRPVGGNTVAPRGLVEHRSVGCQRAGQVITCGRTPSTWEPHPRTSRRRGRGRPDPSSARWW